LESAKITLPLRSVTKILSILEPEGFVNISPSLFLETEIVCLLVLLTFKAPTVIRFEKVYAKSPLSVPSLLAEIPAT
jgi:hypothetical protein